VLDGSNRPVDYFKLFYSDHAEITRFTNLNAATTRARGDKGVWTDVTVVTRIHQALLWDLK
jgi:hypothetical protein